MTTRSSRIPTDYDNWLDRTLGRLSLLSVVGEHIEYHARQLKD